MGQTQSRTRLHGLLSAFGRGEAKAVRGTKPPPEIQSRTRLHFSRIIEVRSRSDREEGADAAVPARLRFAPVYGVMTPCGRAATDIR